MNIWIFARAIIINASYDSVCILAQATFDWTMGIVNNMLNAYVCSFDHIF